MRTKNEQTFGNNFIIHRIIDTIYKRCKHGHKDNKQE